MPIPAVVIQKKRDGKELSSEEIRDFVAGMIAGEIADYQVTAFLMAVFFRGMTAEETSALTEAMLASGDRYDLSRIPGPKVDKHSTGGVGDKVSLILAPLAAACGLNVPMMSGRGLGHSGGTLDKLESISGFDVRLPRERFEDVLRKAGCAIVGQTETIAPADKKLYALRDVTATVECIPLIVSSILSKKLAEGAEALVLDVKVGSGAFMKTPKKALALAHSLVHVAGRMGLPCCALLTRMDQPLGWAVGNALEVQESIEVLRNERSPVSADFQSSDLREITLQLCAQMLLLGGVCAHLDQARTLAEGRLRDGSAWKVFQNMVRLQGGSLEQVLDPSRLPQAPRQYVWTAKKQGYISRMDTEVLGRILVELGGGRKRASDSVDPSVGMAFHRKLGAKINPGDPIATVHAPEMFSGMDALERAFDDAVGITEARRPVPKLIVGQVRQAEELAGGTAFSPGRVRTQSGA